MHNDNQAGVDSKEVIKKETMWKTPKKLLREFFCTKRERNKRDRSFIYALEARSLAIFFGYTIARASGLIIQKGAWYVKVQKCEQEGAELGNCLADYNDELLDPIEKYVRMLLNIEIIASVVICLISLTGKFRWATNACLYLECAIRMTAVLIPNTVDQNRTCV